MIKPLTLGAATLATLGLTFVQFGTPSAWADGGQADVDATAAQIADVAPASAPVATTTVAGNQATAQADGMTASVPLDSAQPITLTDTGSTNTVKPSFTISLPKELQAGKGQKAKNGTMVYRSSQKTGAHGAVQVHADGSTSLDTVIDSVKGATSFTYTIGNAVPELQADGSVLLVHEDTSQSGMVGRQAVGQIAAPWAKDAKGNPVATHFQVVGNKLVQIIQTNNRTAFPVVADPRIVWVHWYMPEILFSYSETGAVRQRAVLQALAGSICLLTSEETFGAACIGFLAESAAIAATASNAYGDHMCLALRYGVVPYIVNCATGK